MIVIFNLFQDSMDLNHYYHHYSIVIIVSRQTGEEVSRAQLEHTIPAVPAQLEHTIPAVPAQLEPTIPAVPAQSQMGLEPTIPAVPAQSQMGLGLCDYKSIILQNIGRAAFQHYR